MTETKVSIGQVKRDISDLVNRVAYGHERIVLTSRGKPKAVLVSLEDYERLQELPGNSSEEAWRFVSLESARLSTALLARRKGEPIDADALWDEVIKDRETRNAIDAIEPGD